MGRMQDGGRGLLRLPPQKIRMVAPPVANRDADSTKATCASATVIILAAITTSTSKGCLASLCLARSLDLWRPPSTTGGPRSTTTGSTATGLHVGLAGGCTVARGMGNTSPRQAIQVSQAQAGPVHPADQAARAASRARRTRPRPGQSSQAGYILITF